MLSTKSLAAKTESAAPDYKRSKERVTILACSNATSHHRMELTMIEKAKNPKTQKNTKTNSASEIFQSEELDEQCNFFKR